jgi:c(7)-type cytochrome triheme protein
MASSSLAVGTGKILEFSNNPQGSVTMDGTTHANAGLTCADCHNKELFPDMKLGAVKITMKDIQAGKLCGKCHNGKGAFAIKDNCSRCHYAAGA